MLLPEGVLIDGGTGAVSPETGRYTKRLSDLGGLFQDAGAYRQALAQDDAIVYEVIEYKRPGSDLFFGTTIMAPGKVGSEYYMTRGHFHRRRDMGEIYYTQRGAGMLVLENREGRAETVAMRPGVCAFIPPDWAHRSVNVGDETLVFVWVCNPLAGNDYGDILRTGMRRLVVEVDGGPAVVANPAFGAGR